MTNETLSAAGVSRIKKATVTKAADLTGAVWDFPGQGQLKINVAEFGEAVTAAALLNGFVQALSDSYSSAKTPAEAFAMASAKLEAWKNGEWTIKGSGGDGGQIVEALVRVTGKTADQVRDLWASLDDAAKAKVKADKRVKLELAKIAQERLEAQLATMDEDAPLF